MGAPWTEVFVRLPWLASLVWAALLFAGELSAYQLVRSLSIPRPAPSETGDGEGVPAGKTQPATAVKFFRLRFVILLVGFGALLYWASAASTVADMWPIGFTVGAGCFWCIAIIADNVNTMRILKRSTAVPSAPTTGVEAAYREAWRQKLGQYLVWLLLVVVAFALTFEPVLLGAAVSFAALCARAWFAARRVRAVGSPAPPDGAAPQGPPAPT